MIESMKWEKIQSQIMQFQPQSGLLMGLIDHTVIFFGGGNLSQNSSNISFSYDLGFFGLNYLFNSLKKPILLRKSLFQIVKKLDLFEIQEELSTKIP